MTRCDTGHFLDAQDAQKISSTRSRLKLFLNITLSNLSHHDALLRALSSASAFQICLHLLHLLTACTRGGSRGIGSYAITD